MMIHRKIHGEVKDCIDLIKNQCSRGESCWWNHNLKEQVFQQVKEKLPPPIQNSHVMQQEISQQEIQMSQQHQTMQMNPNQTILNMLTVMNLELMKVKEALNIK